MNLFNAHPQNQGITYSAHLLFAMSIAFRLMRCVLAFASHAVFPFIGIRRALDLEATSRFLQKQNNWIESRDKKQPQTEDRGQWGNVKKFVEG